MSKDFLKFSVNSFWYNEINVHFFFFFLRFLFAFVLYNKTYWNTPYVTFAFLQSTKQAFTRQNTRLQSLGDAAPLYEGNTYEWRSTLYSYIIISSIILRIQKNQRYIEAIKHKTIYLAFILTLVIWQTILYTFIN